MITVKREASFLFVGKDISDAAQDGNFNRDVTALAAWTVLPAYAAGTWALQAPVNPAGYVSASLNSVWCASASDCIAVGDYQNSSNAYGALAEQWNGSKWSLQSPYSPTSAQLYGISCVSASSCEAVGSDSAGELAEHWNGSFWAGQVLSGGRGADSGVVRYGQRLRSSGL